MIWSWFVVPAGGLFGTRVGDDGDQVLIEHRSNTRLWARQDRWVNQTPLVCGFFFFSVSFPLRCSCSLFYSAGGISVEEDSGLHIFSVRTTVLLFCASPQSQVHPWGLRGSGPDTDPGLYRNLPWAPDVDTRGPACFYHYLSDDMKPQQQQLRLSAASRWSEGLWGFLRLSWDVWFPVISNGQ